jgi:uncharacterized membrane protein YbhN (UPF0104 family)
VSGAALSTPAAHVLCVLFVIVDGVTRAWRLQTFVRAFGGSLRFRHALRANLVEDAAAAVTPMRLGGQPARLAVLARAGVSTATAIGVSVVEAAVMYPLVALAAIGVALAFAPEWWQTIGVRLGHSAVSAGRWLAAGAAITLVAWIGMRRVLPHHHQAASRTIAYAWRELRRVEPATLLLTSLLTLVSVAARVAILPVLTLTLVPPSSPPVGAVTLSSFVLLYGQLILPTPSGAGAVEAGFLSGGVGLEGGAPTTRLLLAWRIYTSLLSIAAGLILVAASVASALVRRRAPTTNDVSDGIPHR